MSDKLRVAIAGLGTVGVSVFKILEKSKVAGREVSVVAVSARDKSKDRGIDLSKTKWFDNAADMAHAPDIDLIIELIGGADGSAYDLTVEAIKNNKDIVTANKALLALKGAEINELMKDSSSKLYYEAAVGAAIPCIKVIRESLADREIKSVSGILNGTCNYILSEMLSSSKSFDEVLKDAQDIGYAEPDPTFDIEGYDAAHKLALLAALSFKTLPNYDAIGLKGITDIKLDDLMIADELGYKIKLFGRAAMVEGNVEIFLEPCLISKDRVAANIDGANNIVSINTDIAGEINLTGLGAGGDATASAILADIASIIHDEHLPLFTGDNKLEYTAVSKSDYFVKLDLSDNRDMADKIGAILQDNKIELGSMFESDDEGDVLMVLILKDAIKANLLKAINEIIKISEVSPDYALIRVIKD